MHCGYGKVDWCMSKCPLQGGVRSRECPFWEVPLYDQKNSNLCRALALYICQSLTCLTDLTTPSIFPSKMPIIIVLPIIFSLPKSHQNRKNTGWGGACPQTPPRGQVLCFQLIMVRRGGMPPDSP